MQPLAMYANTKPFDRSSSRIIVDSPFLIRRQAAPPLSDAEEDQRVRSMLKDLETVAESQSKANPSRTGFVSPSTSCTDSSTIAFRDGAELSAIVSASPWWWSDAWSLPSSGAVEVAFSCSR